MKGASSPESCASCVVKAVHEGSHGLPTAAIPTAVIPTAANETTQSLRLDYALGARLVILHAAQDCAFENVWKRRVRRESSSALCFVGASAMHVVIAALNAAKFS